MKRLVLVAFLVFVSAAGACGVERWQIKTLTDPAAKQVDFKHVHNATVTQLVSLPMPASEPSSRLDAEKTVQRVHALVLAYKREADGDIHVVLGDPQNPGTTMIAELPTLACTYGAQHRYAMKLARDRFEAQVGVPSGSWKRPNTPATVVGVLFFDRLHHQTGVAPNGIELHPLIGFKAG